MELTAAIYLALAIVLAAPDLEGRWALSQGQNDYRCEDPALILDLKQDGPGRLTGAYTGKALNRPSNDTFTLLDEASAADAGRLTEGRVVRFTTTTRRSGVMRFVSKQHSPTGLPTRMEWQLRDRAGKPFRTLFWMQRCGD